MLVPEGARAQESRDRAARLRTLDPGNKPLSDDVNGIDAELRGPGDYLAYPHGGIRHRPVQRDDGWSILRAAGDHGRIAFTRLNVELLVRDWPVMKVVLVAVEDRVRSLVRFKDMGCHDASLFIYGRGWSSANPSVVEYSANHSEHGIGETNVGLNHYSQAILDDSTGAQGWRSGGRVCPA